MNCRLPTLGREGGKRSAPPPVIMTFDSKFELTIQSEVIEPAGARCACPLPDRLVFWAILLGRANANATN